MVTTANIPLHEITPDMQAFIVDVRNTEEFMNEHIPGTKHTPLNILKEALPELQKQEKIILSCHSGKRALQAYETLTSAGLRNVYILEGSLIGWKQAGRETRSLHQGVSVMRQVQIIVGVMILTGMFFKPLWYLTLLAGMGMLMAGLTNTCMMATLLSKMPWNQPKRNSES